MHGSIFLGGGGGGEGVTPWGRKLGKAWGEVHRFGGEASPAPPGLIPAVSQRDLFAMRVDSFSSS